MAAKEIFFSVTPEQAKPVLDACAVNGWLAEYHLLDGLVIAFATYCGFGAPEEQYLVEIEALGKQVEDLTEATGALDDGWGEALVQPGETG